MRRGADSTACLVLGEGIHAMLLDHARFADFSPLPVADAFATKEVLTCLTCEDPSEVDDLVGRAVAAGGKQWKEGFTDGPMYGGSFQDSDGHVWELVSMEGEASVSQP